MAPNNANPPSYEDLSEENEMLKQQLSDLKKLYKVLHETDINPSLKGTNGVKIDQALYRELRFEKSRRIQLERMVQRLQKANDIRRECISEVENFGLEVKSMVDEVTESNGPNTVNVSYLKKWTESFLQRLRSLHLATEKSERQGLFLPGTGYVNENVLGIEGLNISEIVQGKYQDIPYINTYNLALLEDRLNELYKYTCKLGNTVKHTLIPNHHALEEQIVQDVVVNDVLLLLKKIDTVRRELSLLGAVVPSKFESTLKKGNGSKSGKSVRESIAFSNDDTEEATSYLSINTKELLQRLPKFSRSPSECESSLRSLAKCINTQKHIWNLEKEMLHEEIAFHQKMYRAYKLYATEMLTQIDQLQKRYLPTPEKPSTPASDIKCIEEIYESFNDFDQDSNEINLRKLLRTLKINTSRVNYLLDTIESKNNSHYSNRNLQKDLAMLSRECEVIENEYKSKINDILGRKYELEEDLMQREMFLNFVPYTVPLNEEKSNTLYNVNEEHVKTERFSLAHEGSSFSLPISESNFNSIHQSSVPHSQQNISSSRGQPPARSASSFSVTSSIHSDISNVSERISKTIKKTKPTTKIDKKPSSSLPPNVIELQELVEESQAKIEDMESRLEFEELTSMQQYAIRKQIALEKANMKKHERTLKNITT